jgi:hypothetical protein
MHLHIDTQKIDRIESVVLPSDELFQFGRQSEIARQK